MDAEADRPLVRSSVALVPNAVFLHPWLICCTDHTSSQGCFLFCTCTHTVHACEACTCNKQPLGNILTVIHGSVLSAKKCWPLLSSMEKLHNPYGFPNYELFPSGYAKSTLLSHLYPNIVLFLYCTKKRLFAMHSFQRQLSASAEAL